MRIFEWEFLAVYHHPDRFDDHGHCESKDMFLTCHVTSPDHAIIWMEAAQSKSPTCQVKITLDTVAVEI